MFVTGQRVLWVINVLSLLKRDLLWAPNVLKKKGLDNFVVWSPFISLFTLFILFFFPVMVVFYLPELEKHVLDFSLIFSRS